MYHFFSSAHRQKDEQILSKLHWSYGNQRPLYAFIHPNDCSRFNTTPLACRHWQTQTHLMFYSRTYFAVILIKSPNSASSPCTVYGLINLWSLLWHTLPSWGEIKCWKLPLKHLALKRSSALTLNIFLGTEVNFVVVGTFCVVHKQQCCNNILNTPNLHTSIELEQVIGNYFANVYLRTGSPELSTAINTCGNYAKTCPSTGNPWIRFQLQ